MKLLTIPVLLLTCVVMVAVAQVPTTRETPDYEEPERYAGNPSNCLELKVKMLHLATDPSDPQQNGYLTAANAYQQLYEEGQQC